MTETSKDTLFEFPCDFPLKVMGRKTDDFRSIVLGIVQKHAGPIEPSNIALLDRYYEDYGKGTLDIVAFLHFDFGALARHPRAKMEAWREEYLRDIMAPLVLPKARELIASHEARHHVTAIVTAGNSFLTEPIAKMIGVGHLLASDPEVAGGQFTGRIDGIPCFHEGKIAKLDAWLAARGGGSAAAGEGRGGFGHLRVLIHEPLRVIISAPLTATAEASFQPVAASAYPRYARADRQESEGSQGGRFRCESSLQLRPYWSRRSR